MMSSQIQRIQIILHKYLKQTNRNLHCIISDSRCIRPNQPLQNRDRSTETNQGQAAQGGARPKEWRKRNRAPPTQAQGRTDSPEEERPRVPVKERLGNRRQGRSPPCGQDRQGPSNNNYNRGNRRPRDEPQANLYSVTNAELRVITEMRKVNRQ